MHKFFRWSCGLFLAFVATVAQATTLPQLEVEELFEAADVVVIAQIQSGHRVMAGEHRCGARYEAKIIHSLKGELEEESIVEFGPYLGHGIGDKLLLFLKGRGSRFEPMTSSTGAILSAMAEHERRCAASEAAYNIMFQGLGALEINGTSKFRSEAGISFPQAIKFREKWVLPPASLERKPAEPGDDRILSEESWVREDDFVEYIRRLEFLAPEDSRINE